MIACSAFLLPDAFAADQKGAEKEAQPASTRSDAKKDRSRKSRRVFNVRVDYETSMQRRKEIVSAIASALSAGKLLTEPAVREEIVKKISEVMPYEPTAPLKVQTREALIAQARKEIDAKYDALEAGYRAKSESLAKEKFPLYRYKDEVTLVYQKGPRTYTVSGKLYQARDGIVQIDDTKIAFIDLSEADLAKFDVDANVKQRAKWVETEMNAFEKAKNEEFQNRLTALWREVIQTNEANGYIYHPDQDRWETAREIAEAEMTKANVVQRRILARKKQEQAKKAKETATEEKSPEEIEATARELAKEREARALLRRCEEVREKSKKRLAELEDRYRNGGVDIDPGYKYALWGYSVADARAALALEPEGKYHVEGKPGVDVFESDVKRSPDEFDETPEKLELIYQNGMLDKVVLYYPDAKIALFQNLIKSLQNKYGRSEEERAAQESGFSDNLLNDILSGRKIEMRAIEEGEETPFAFSKMKLRKDRDGKRIAPVMLTWRGETGVASLLFYLDSDAGLAESVLLCKERIETPAEEPAEQAETPDSDGNGDSE